MLEREEKAEQNFKKIKDRVLARKHLSYQKAFGLSSDVERGGVQKNFVERNKNEMRNKSMLTRKQSIERGSEVLKTQLEVVKKRRDL